MQRSPFSRPSSAAQAVLAPVRPEAPASSQGRFGPGWLLLGVFAALAWIQVRIGGTRPAFAYPGYLILGATALASLFFVRRASVPRLLPMATSLAFFGYCLLRAVTSPVPYVARTDLYLILAALAVYFLTAVYGTGPQARLFFIAGLLALGMGHLALGIVQFTRGNNFLPFGYERADYGARASGFYVCPNHLAGLCECLGSLALALALFGRVPIWARVLWLYGAGASAVGLLLTGSRGGYLSAALAALVFAAFGLWHVWSRALNRRWLVLGVGALVLAGTGFAGARFVGRSALLTQRFGAIADAGDVRPRLWRAAIQQFESAPLTGTGAGTYLIYGRRFRDPSIQMDPVYAHGDYLQLLGEFGALGGLGCFAFLAAHLWCAVGFVRRLGRRLRAGERTFSSSLALTIGALTAVSALLLHSVFDFNLQIPGNTLVVAFLFGILANPGPAGNGEERPPQFLCWTGALLPALIGLPLLVFLPPLLPAENEAETARQALRHEAYALAVLHAKVGLAADPTNPELLYYLGEARRQLGSRFGGPASEALLRGAVEAFESGLKFFPMDDRLLVKGALAHAQLGEWSRADELFQSAFAWSPHLGQIHAYYGLRLQLEHRLDEAVAAYRESNRLGNNAVATAGLQESLGDPGATQPVPANHP